MEVKTTVTGTDLTEGIHFYGDTHYDNESVERLKQLAVVLEDVVSDLENLDRQVRGKGEGSAKKIKRQLDTMKKDLLRIAFGETRDVERRVFYGEDEFDIMRQQDEIIYAWYQDPAVQSIRFEEISRDNLEEDVE